MEKELKSQEAFYFEVIRSLMTFFIEGLEIDSCEVKRELEESATHMGHIERKLTGWKELKIIFKPKSK